MISLHNSFDVKNCHLQWVQVRRKVIVVVRAALQSF